MSLTGAAHGRTVVIYGYAAAGADLSDLLVRVLRDAREVVWFEPVERNRRLIRRAIPELGDDFVPTDLPSDDGDPFTARGGRLSRLPRTTRRQRRSRSRRTSSAATRADLSNDPVGSPARPRLSQDHRALGANETPSDGHCGLPGSPTSLVCASEPSKATALGAPPEPLRRPRRPGSGATTCFSSLGNCQGIGNGP